MTHEQLVERVGIALAIAGGATEKHARSTLWMEPLSGGTLVRRDLREDRGEQPEANWVKMPIWEFHYGAIARAALAVVYEAMSKPTSAMLAAVSALDEFSSVHNYGAQPTAEDIYTALLAASPLNPEAGK